ncbi:formylglycine-generating enzyme family protein, partial [Alkalinema pantanalense CENA528]|uniref:formylglycine-generating enzyme family protein n=1 Tax=Alkalinema pantanalense TaxID=1620705 RepID=UPI003D6E2593
LPPFTPPPPSAMAITITQGYTEPLADGIDIPLVFIPGGSFLMGSPADEPQRFKTEGPQHSVTLTAFCMGQYPITQAQWRIVAGWQPVQRELKPNPSHFQGDRHPVERVSWADAIEFCDRLSHHTDRRYTLPTEAQWEYACRAGTTTPFHCGQTLTPELARYDWSQVYADTPVKKQKFEQSTSPVGTFPANAWGLYDLHGNIWEWCLDDWHSNYNRAPTDGSAWVGKNAEKQARKVIRGGSWISAPRYCRPPRATTTSSRSLSSTTVFVLFVFPRTFCNPFPSYPLAL